MNPRPLKGKMVSCRRRTSVLVFDFLDVVMDGSVDSNPSGGVFRGEA
jgi:hypothetical protein